MKYLLVGFIATCFTLSITAQVPQGIPYQAVARNLQGQPVANKNIGVRFSILDSVATGVAVYSETHSLTTSNLGLFNLNIGAGNAAVGSFNAINWGVNFKYLKVELDTNTNGNFIDLGTQQMMAVPYSLYSGKSGAIDNGKGSDPNTMLYTTDGF